MKDLEEKMDELGDDLGERIENLTQELNKRPHVVEFKEGESGQVKEAPDDKKLQSLNKKTDKHST